MIARAFLSLAVIFSLSGVSAGGEKTKSETASASVFALEDFAPAGGSGEKVTTEETNSFRVLREAWRQPTLLSLDDTRRVLFSGAFAWVQAEPADYLPVFMPSPFLWATPAQSRIRELNNPFTVLPEKANSVSGEVGVFYGRSTGKYRREVEQAYILGAITNGNTQINVGASYGRATGRSPRIIGP